MVNSKMRMENTKDCFLMAIEMARVLKRIAMVHHMKGFILMDWKKVQEYIDTLTEVPTSVNLKMTYGMVREHVYLEMADDMKVSGNGIYSTVKVSWHGLMVVATPVSTSTV